MYKTHVDTHMHYNIGGDDGTLPNNILVDALKTLVYIGRSQSTSPSMKFTLGVLLWRMCVWRSFCHQQELVTKGH